MAVRARTLLVRFVGDTKDLNKSIDDVHKQSGAFNKLAAAGNVALKGLAIGGGLAAAGIGYTVKAFGDFDAALNESVAIMKNVTDIQRNDMAKAARQVALETTFSANEAAAAFYYLASSGMDAAQSIKALPLTAKFAQAGMFDLERATDLLINSQIALGMQSSDAEQNLINLTRVADVLTEANNTATGSVEEFAEALTNKAATAMAAMNVEVEEGVAVLAALAQKGKKGQVAGEMLAIFLRDVTRAAARNKAEFKKLGIEIFDTEGNLKNLADVVAEFETALGPMSDSQRAVALEQSGMTKAVGDAIRTLMGSSGAIRQYEADLRKAGGATEEVADKQLQTFNAQVELLKHQLQDFAIEIGSKIVPKLIPFIEQLREALPGAFERVKAAYRELKPTLKDLSDWLKEDFGPAFIDVTKAGVKMARGLTPIITFFRDHPNATKLLAALSGIATVLAIIARVGKAIAPFLGPIAAVLGVIGTVLAAIGGGSIAIGILVVVAVIGSLIVSFLLLKDTIVDVWHWLQGWWDGFIEDWKKLWAGVNEAFFNWKNKFVEDWKNLWNGVKTSASDAWQWLQDTWDGVIDWFKKLPGRVAAAAGNFWDWLWKGFKNAINKIIGWWNNLKFPSKTFSIPHIPGTNIGGDVTIGGWNLPNIEPLAEGAIVKATPGGVLANIGEGGRDEAVIPLDGQHGLGGDTYVFNFDGAVISGSMEFKRLVVEAIRTAGGRGQPITVRGRQL